MTYRMIEDPQEGDLVQYLGVYILRWRPEWSEKPVAFVRDDDVMDILDGLSSLLANTYDALMSLPEDALGTGTIDNNGVPMEYPIRDELLHNLAGKMEQVDKWQNS